jgi:hypothetical protein
MYTRGDEWSIVKKTEGGRPGTEKMTTDDGRWTIEDEINELEPSSWKLQAAGFKSSTSG